MRGWNWPGRTPQGAQATGGFIRPVGGRGVVGPGVDAAPAPAPAAPAPPSYSPQPAPARDAAVGRGQAFAAGDPAGRLPMPAALKLRDLAAREQDIAAAARDLYERRQGVVDRKHEAAANLEGARTGGQFGGRRSPPRENDVAFAQQQPDAVSAELSAIDERLARLTARRSPLAARITEWIRSLPPGAAIELHPAEPPPKLAKGQAPADAIAAARDKRAELQADLHQVRSAPLPSAMAKARMRQQIAALAEKGAPNCLHAIEIGRPVVFATTLQRVGPGGFDN